jgi:hypothetical protein
VRPSTPALSAPSRPSTPPPVGAPKGFAPALIPPVTRSERPSGQIAAVVPQVPMPSRARRPTDPEIETYLEIEADEPPESGLDAELESELALNIALSGDLDHAADAIAPMRKRAITAQDSASVSGTISIPDDNPAPPRRAKRQSDGIED